MTEEVKKAIERAKFLVSIPTYLEKEMCKNLLNHIDKLQKEVDNRIPVKKVEQLINKIENETWYIESGTEAKQACIEELESLLNKE